MIINYYILKKTNYLEIIEYLLLLCIKIDTPLYIHGKWAKSLIQRSSTNSKTL